jgi:hypothetical protein
MNSADFVVSGQLQLCAIKRFPVVEFADYECRLAEMQNAENLATRATGLPWHFTTRLSYWRVGIQ